LARWRLYGDGGCHARADQYTLGHIVDMDAYQDALGKPDPLEGRVGIDEELGSGEIVTIGNAAGDALDMTAQRRRAVQQIDLGLFTYLYSWHFGFLEIAPVLRPPLTR
jgi:hypothetical protein